MRIPIATVGELADGESKSLCIDGKNIALFFTAGMYYAVEDRCPHAGAPLSGGPVEDGIVTCPWHYWRFRLSDGVGADLPKARVACFAVIVEGHTINIDLQTFDVTT